MSIRQEKQVVRPRSNTYLANVSVTDVKARGAARDVVGTLRQRMEERSGDLGTTSSTEVLESSEANESGEGRPYIPVCFRDYINYPPHGWKEVFQSQPAIASLENTWRLITQGDKGYEAFPYIEEVFTAFDLTPLEKIKVVVIGQDPYHSFDSKVGEPDAHGLAFSVKPRHVIPPSLRNIFTQVKADYPDDKRLFQSGSLAGWARQGVFLLNTALTVLPGRANSHKGLYRGFIKLVIDAIKKKNPKCIWLLWGRDAEGVVDTVQYSLVSTHPSPFSYANNKYGQSFQGNQHFITCNEMLVKFGKTPIDWFDHE